MAIRFHRRQQRRSSFENVASLPDTPKLTRLYIKRLNNDRSGTWEYYDGIAWSGSLDTAYFWKEADPADLFSLLRPGSEGIRDGAKS